ncbi:ABC transporter ATP-binding protein [Oceanobacillus piezotolerans]|uniref:ABC transporter ATP-binding protein n=1 Tax=Oceanobacillus piezotolerans TaxID=2448030 RepID=A0A498D6I8_9BACI|nr:ABC transporter ATP-binding protein [Oceanobacillus piezotolerans]RLL43624.1 ABC transporter ATP-binding protein [Oceanobacillus piezotolerans]
MSKPMFIEVKDVSKSFRNNGKDELILKDINLSVNQRETIAILGQSGCGKSTLLNIIGGFEPANVGQVLLDGKEVTKPSKKSVMLFQHYGLLPWRSVLKNVELGLEDSNLSKEERKKQAYHYVELVGLGDKANHFPRQLSGGMQQRVSIARALAIEPDVLLMDEPFGALDTFNRYYLQDELIRIQQEMKTTIIIVTHDIDEAIYLADRVVVMGKEPGRIQREIVIDSYKPRDRSGDEFQYYRKQILQEFHLNSSKPPLEYHI